jgi:hypothetical protein
MERSASSTWFFCAREDRIASDLMARVRRLGLPLAASPESAARAVVVLSPELAEEDPPTLRDWAHERGAEMLALTLSSGAAPWDDDAGRFSTGADAVPPGLHDAFTVQPIMLDLRGAGPAKLDRCARRLAGAMAPPSPAQATPPPTLPAETAAAPPPLQPRKSRRLGLWVVAALAVLLIGFVLLSLTTMSGETPPATTTPPTTATAPTTATPPTTSSTPGPEPVAGGSYAFVWVLVALLAAGFAAVLVALRGRRRRSRAVDSRPLPQSDAQTAELQVFISHDVGADSAVARRIADRLVQGRLRVWFAPVSLRPGEDFVIAIAEAISSSRAALILLSPTALRSNWVRREMAWIVNREIEGHLHVVPVRVAECDVPLLLSTYQWVDLADFDQAVGELVRWRRTPRPPDRSAIAEVAGGRTPWASWPSAATSAPYQRPRSARCRTRRSGRPWRWSSSRRGDRDAAYAARSTVPAGRPARRLRRDGPKYQRLPRCRRSGIGRQPWKSFADGSPSGPR